MLRTVAKAMLLLGMCLAGWSQVLVPGSPALTRELATKVIDVYEELLDVHFTRIQRDEFAGVLVSYWQRGEQASIRNAVECAQLHDQWAVLPPDVRRRTVESVRTNFIQSLRSNTQDPASRWLLQLQQRAGGPQPVTQLVSSSPVPTGGVPPQLVGRWRMSQGSGSSFYNPNTGHHGTPNINMFEYVIHPDGRYEHNALLNSSLYNCEMKIFGRETGQLTSESQSVVIFTDTHATFESQDTCRPQWNYKKPGDLRRKVLEWRLEQDQYGVKLVLRNQKSEIQVFRRQ